MLEVEPNNIIASQILRFTNDTETHIPFIDNLIGEQISDLQKFYETEMKPKHEAGFRPRIEQCPLLESDFSKIFSQAIVDKGI